MVNSAGANYPSTEKRTDYLKQEKNHPEMG